MLQFDLMLLYIIQSRLEPITILSIINATNNQARQKEPKSDGFDFESKK